MEMEMEKCGVEIMEMEMGEELYCMRGPQDHTYVGKKILNCI